MSEQDRRVTLRKPLPVGVYLIVGGERHPGTLRDLSTTGAGFSDPVLAVRLHLRVGQRVTLEIPAGLEGQEALPLPAEVVHVSGGLRPRLGLRFGELDAGTQDRLIDRLGRKQAAPGRSGAPGDAPVRGASRDVRFVLVESSDDEARGSSSSARATAVLLAVAAILLLLAVLLVLGWLTR